MKNTYLQFQDNIVKGSACFAGANTSMGFLSEYDGVCSDARHIYIIKGSAGCGKSSKLHELAELAEKNGLAVQRYHCGSDPASLDAIKLTNGKERIVLLDGTAPHAVEAKYPILRHEIVDLGVFLSEAKLMPFENEIVSCSEGKVRAYRNAYKCLSWTAALSREIKKLCLAAYDVEKARATVGRSLGKLDCQAGASRECFMHAVTMRGSVHLIAEKSKDATTIELRGDTDEKLLLLATIYDMCKKRAAMTVVSRSPIEPSEPLELALPSGGVVFRAVGGNDDAAEQLNTARFFRRSDRAAARGERRFYEKLRESVFSSALASLELAAHYHFRLEEIYGAAMDFDRLNEYMQNKYREVLSRLI